MIAGNKAAADKALEEELYQPEKRLGEIILVGAGPGDAGLLTLRGLQAVQKADVVFYDHLVTPEIRELVRRDAEMICVGKRAGEHSVPQHETNQMLVDAAREGKTVVRLKGGDPFIFGRGGEEYGTHTLKEWFNPKGVYACEQKSILMLSVLAGLDGVIAPLDKA